MPLLVDPFVSFDTINREEMNLCLDAWGHRMGPILRPEYRTPIDFALRVHGEPVAVIAADTLIRETCRLTRSEAFELSRLCAPEHGMCSFAMRVWKRFAYPVIVKAWGTPWVVSYQDAASAHKGNLYRYDDWLILGYSTSGIDPRAHPETASVRRKVIWGWNADSEAMNARRLVSLDVPAWAQSQVA